MAVGAYRRAVTIAADAGAVSAEMEDDFHHFAVTLRHDGATIESVSADSIRAPWVTCPAAGLALERLAGRAIVAPMTFASNTERYANCTHMLDLANLALAHAHEPGLRRRYDIEVDFPADRSTVAALDLDGSRLLDWRLVDGKISGGSFAGHSPDTALGDPRVKNDITLREAVVVFRRALRISGARLIDLDSFGGSLELGPIEATCHSLLPAVRPLALRNRGSTRDFSGTGRRPLSETVETTE
jgi:hypothetical protein